MGEGVTLFGPLKKSFILLLSLGFFACSSTEGTGGGGTGVGGSPLAGVLLGNPGGGPVSGDNTGDNNPANNPAAGPVALVGGGAGGGAGPQDEFLPPDSGDVFKEGGQFLTLVPKGLTVAQSEMSYYLLEFGSVPSEDPPVILNVYGIILGKYLFANKIFPENYLLNLYYYNPETGVCKIGNKTGPMPEKQFYQSPLHEVPLVYFDVGEITMTDANQERCRLVLARYHAIMTERAQRAAQAEAEDTTPQCFSESTINNCAEPLALYCRRNANNCPDDIVAVRRLMNIVQSGEEVQHCRKKYLMEFMERHTNELITDARFVLSMEHRPELQTAELQQLVADFEEVQTPIQRLAEDPCKWVPPMNIPKWEMFQTLVTEITSQLSTANRLLSQKQRIQPADIQLPNLPNTKINVPNFPINVNIR